jgi:hypothetical protein
MTVEEVEEVVRVQSADHLTATNDHRIALKQALVRSHKISVIARTVEAGRVKDRNVVVWLVGQEPRNDGYKIVMRDDGLQFGLASDGFLNDRLPVLDGWYGDLMSAFLSM